MDMLDGPRSPVDKLDRRDIKPCLCIGCERFLYKGHDGLRDAEQGLAAEGADWLPLLRPLKGNGRALPVLVLDLRQCRGRS